MNHQSPDVQASQPDVTVGLGQVGVTGAEKLVKIVRDGKRPLVLMAEFEVFVDLSGDHKGIDTSRNMQIIDEVLEAAVSESAYRVEDMCGNTTKRLFTKHEYTATAKVSMTTEFIVREGIPASGLSTQSAVEIITSVTVTDEDTREEIGTEVVGIIVCPCSQGISVFHARDVLQDLVANDDTIERSLGKVPQPGYSQRGHAMLTVETQGSPGVDPMDPIDIARDPMSTRTHNLTEHPDEDHTTYHVHTSTKSVEGRVRPMAELSLGALDRLGDDMVAHMKQSSGESAHQHNVHAERKVMLGQLRDELDA